MVIFTKLPQLHAEVHRCAITIRHSHGGSCHQALGAPLPLSRQPSFGERPLGPALQRLGPTEAEDDAMLLIFYFQELKIAWKLHSAAG